jgi:hypothetical protein
MAEDDFLKNWKAGPPTQINVLTDDGFGKKADRIETWKKEEAAILSRLAKSGVRIEYIPADLGLQSYIALSDPKDQGQWNIAVGEYFDQCVWKRNTLYAIEKFVSDWEKNNPDSTRLSGFSITIDQSAKESIVIADSPQKIVVSRDVTAEDLRKYAEGVEQRNKAAWERGEVMGQKMDADRDAFFGKFPVAFEGVVLDENKYLNDLRKTLLNAFKNDLDFLHGFVFVVSEEYKKVEVVKHKSGNSNSLGEIRMPIAFDGAG